MSKKDVADSKSIGRYLLESLDRIIAEQKEKFEEGGRRRAHERGVGKPPAFRRSRFVQPRTCLRTMRRRTGRFSFQAPSWLPN